MSSNSFKPSTSYCNYCGDKFLPNNKKVRFCSIRCEKLFGTKFTESQIEEFHLSNELLKLQLQLQKSVIPTDLLSKEALLVFYDSIFSQIAKILKSINEQALEKEKNSTTNDFNALKNKLESLIVKATELRIENKALKQKLSLIKNQDSILASTLLGVENNAGLNTYKKAFKTKVKQFHPDVYSENDDIFKALQLAFEIIRVTKGESN
ncbi:MAG: J domain-containing protein [Bacteroidetes bacterium]|nr:J domain-containing protein [Bacteroidota bacterium]